MSISNTHCDVMGCKGCNFNVNAKMCTCAVRLICFRFELKPSPKRRYSRIYDQKCGPDVERINNKHIFWFNKDGHCKYSYLHLIFYIFR